MKEVWNWIQVLVAAIGGFFGWFFGGFDGFLYALLVFVIVDYITGVMCAIADKKLSSEVGFKGISKKVMIFICVAFAAAIQTQMSLPVRDLTIWFFIANEGISLLENVSAFVPVPEKLKEVLSQLRDKTSVFKDKEE